MDLKGDKTQLLHFIDDKNRFHYPFETDLPLNYYEEIESEFKFISIQKCSFATPIWSITTIFHTVEPLDVSL